MLGIFVDIFSDRSTGLRGKVIGLYALLLGLNAVAWIWALGSFHDHPVLLGTALLVGSIEALGLVSDKLNLQGGFWDFIGALNDNFGTVGYLIIGVFAASWLISSLIYRLNRFDEIEARSN